MKSLSNFSD
jgi:hypothetical protein